MTDHANRLWELLGELEARPDELLLSDPCEGEEYWWNGHDPIDDEHAHAILCNAARRVCDANSVRIDWALESGGRIISYGVVDPKGNMIADCVDDYESTLITGLEWIIEQRKPSNPES
jgi:hypothetical protein